MSAEEVNATLGKPLAFIKGIGDSRAVLFQKLGVFTVEDAVTYYPRDYEDRRSLKSIGNLLDGEACSFEGTIVSKVTESRPRKGLVIYKVLIRDETGSITATWYNQHYIKNIFHPNDRYIFFGKAIRRFKTLEVQNPVYERIEEDREKKNTCRIIPVYPATAKLPQTIIRSVVHNALKLVEDKLEEPLPPWIRQQYSLSEINYSVQNIHFPKSLEDFNLSRYRLAFEELLVLQLGMMNIKRNIEGIQNGIVFDRIPQTEDFIRRLPFRLTDAQLRVFREIQQDMESSHVMSRLVQGDVGSGKTIVAALALYKAVRSGYQGTLMVPTEILAEQHFASLEPLLGHEGIRVGILTGSKTRKQKTDTLEAIRSGELDVVIGTHALIEDQVEFKSLGLVVTDEQHRFGVRQRAVLSAKGVNPDVLVMTATPIPRTLALILYGDLDISIIDQMPPGRKPIDTYAVDNGTRDRINRFIRKKVEEGRQVYIVCPLVEESETVEAKSAQELAEKIAREDFKDLRVGLVHGRMKPAEKDRVMKAYVAGEIDILVSTTVIEVGVNVPNATVMVVENAERFGLAQLHQLRGRVGRGEHQSYCILYNQSDSDVSRQRMGIMQKSNDGFVISEKDLELRGPGDFFGTRQHGIPNLKVANLYQDMDILKLAQEAAQKICTLDPGLLACEHKGLKDRVEALFKSCVEGSVFS